MNETMKKFGYPDSVVREYQNWVLLLRPQQATLGALVLVCKDDVDTFSKISLAAFAELKKITTAIECHLHDCFRYDKINYLMLMMVDPDVHFHVLPRYAHPCFYDQTEFKDPGWPGPPDLAYANAAGRILNQGIRERLQRAFGGKSVFGPAKEC